VASTGTQADVTVARPGSKPQSLETVTAGQGWSWKRREGWQGFIANCWSRRTQDVRGQNRSPEALTDLPGWWWARSPSFSASWLKIALCGVSQEIWQRTQVGKGL